MSKKSLQPSCSAAEVDEWCSDSQSWKKRIQVDLQVLHCSGPREDCLVSAGSQISLIYANANDIRKCNSCRKYFTKRFRIPATWWLDYSRKSNGYFGYQQSTKYIETWTYFETKQLDEGEKYHWDKLNVFIKWNKATHQTVVLVFDKPKLADKFRYSIKNPTLRTLQSPFWFYPHLLSELAQLQESAVWTIRDRVRAAEKEATPAADRRPEPNYRHLHDIGRHAIHVSETLDVACHTIERMLTQYKETTETLMSDSSNISRVSTISSSETMVVDNDVKIANYNEKIAEYDDDEMSENEDDGDEIDETLAQLQFFDSFMTSLRFRSRSNDKRLHNEIQLAFNVVAQHDAATSVRIGLAAQEDSVTMRSISYVTLTFLPPTFISAIFSMSFFNFDPPPPGDSSSGWSVAPEFWMYWAVAVPITLATALVLYLIRVYSVGSAAMSTKTKEAILMQSPYEKVKRPYEAVKRSISSLV